LTEVAQTKIYGNTDPTLSFTAEANSANSGLATTDTSASFTGALTRAAGENVASYAIANTLANGNYSITVTDGTFAITQRPITLTADAQTKVSGNSDPSLTYTAEANSASRGLVAGDTFGALTRTAGENVGNHTINASALANGNYLISAVNGRLTITSAPEPEPASTGRNQAADNAVRSAQRQVSSGTNAVAAGSSANATWRSMPSPEQSAGFGPLSSQPIGSTSSNVSQSGGLVFVQMPDSAPNAPTTTGSTAEVATSGGTDTAGFMRVSVIRGGINFGEYSETLAR